MGGFDRLTPEFVEWFQTAFVLGGVAIISLLIFTGWRDMSGADAIKAYVKRRMGWLFLAVILFMIAAVIAGERPQDELNRSVPLNRNADPDRDPLGELE
ncbi:MAG: hypothetical protein AAGB03_04825 [Pseudomonadota bacterium]